MIMSYQVTKAEKKRIPLYLQLITLDYHQEPVQRPSGIGINQWFLCTSGTGEVIIDGKRSIVHAGDGFLITAKTPHRYKGIEGDFILNALGFNGSIVSKLLLSLGMNENGVYHFNNPAGFIEKLRNLEHITHLNLENEKMIYSGEIYNILLFLANSISKIKETTTASSNIIVKTIIDYLEENYDKDISLDNLAAETGKTTEYLCKIFKKETTQTIIHILMEIRIAHARVFLCTYPEKNVAEIGKMCGFQSPSYFGKIFRKYMNMSPNDYRAHNM